jgi:purine-nucleoside phosphorylase
MEDWLTSADEAVRFILHHWPGCHPAVGIVLGSGLGGFADMLENPEVLDASSIPHWPVSTVAGHQGRLVLGEARGKQVLALQGRIHYYEGYSIQQVSFPVRVLGRLGVRRLILTNASGGIRPDLAPGELMLITDHVNFMGTNPLIGPNESAFGERFPDMSSVYDPEWIARAGIAADEAGIPLKKGILAATSGPSYETPAEVEMLRRLGADAVCMSTVPEAIAAAHMGIRVLGISCVANAACGLSSVKLSHEDVRRNVSSSQALFNRLIAGILSRLET